MKYLTLLPFLLMAVLASGQKPIFVEIKDTVETSYDLSYGEWFQEDFNMQRQEIRDSVGLDTFRLYKFYYLDTIKGEVKKTYLDMALKKIVGRRKGKDYRF